MLASGYLHFLLIGAYALAVHGFPRATADIDIFVKPGPENASILYKTLEKFGAPLENISIADFTHPRIILQIGVAPRRIDIITKIDGMTYDEASQGKEIVNIENLSIPIISKQNLIINKLATGREKDKIDAKNLKNS